MGVMIPKCLVCTGANILNDNGEQLLSLAGDNKLSVARTFFTICLRAESYTRTAS